MAGNSKTPGRSVISKVSAILLTVAENRQSTLTEIAAQSGLPLSTTHRLVAELTAWGVLERRGDGRFRAGRSLRAISGACPCVSSNAVAGLRERAAPVIEDLVRVTGAWVRVGYLDGTAVAYIEKTSAHVPVSDVRPARLPVHATALGKALLAFTPPLAVARILAGQLPQYNPRTLSRAEPLRLDLRTVRATGLAMCDGELHPQWSSVAMPVFGPGGGVVAALELRVGDLARDVPAWRPALAVAARALSRELAQQNGPHSTESFARSSLDRPARTRATLVQVATTRDRRANELTDFRASEEDLTVDRVGSRDVQPLRHLQG